MAPEIIETDFLVLRKTPYSDTSLIVAGLAPDRGQVHLLARGARRLGKRRFPMVDLFRVLRVQYRPARAGLASLRSAELKEDFSAISRSAERFVTAGRLARFALDNTHQRLASPLFFSAFRGALRRLADTELSAESDQALMDAAVVCVVLVFLAEHGLLPDGPDPEKIRRQKLLLDAALGSGPLPALPPERWRALREWSLALACYAGCSGFDSGRPC